MNPELHLLTLGVPDLEQARRFYLDGLGWTATLDVPGEITFIQVGHGMLLGLFAAADLEADIGPGAGRRVPGGGGSGVTLAHNVATENEVIAALKVAMAAGATVLKPAQRAAFGGFHGYFADPAGFVWEVATNPGWSVDANGRVKIEPVTK